MNTIIIRGEGCDISDIFWPGKFKSKWLNFFH